MSKKTVTIEEDNEGVRVPGEPIKSDAELMKGGPGDPPGEPSATPELVEISVGGNTFKVPKDAAEAYAAQQASHEQALAEARALKPVEPSASAPAAEPPETKETDYETLIFTDPKAAVSKIKEEVRDEMRAEYNADTSLRDFWNDFYTRHSDLRADKSIVETTLSRNMDTLGGMKGDAAYDKLAELTKGEILSVVERHSKSTGKKPSDTTTLESGGGPELVTNTTDKQEPNKIQSLSDGIKERRKARLAKQALVQVS